MQVIQPYCPERESGGLGHAVFEALRLLPAGGGEPLLVAINDPQRHTDSRAVLREIVRLRPGVAFRVLVACGTHRFAAAERRRFEEAVLAGMPVREVAWHDCESSGLVSVAGAWRGHPWLAASDSLLAVGSVEPHYFAGFTGAHKTCTIGCAAHADVERNHSGALLPAARPGVLEGNPVHEGIAAMAAALERLRPVAAVNLVQAGERIVAACGGALDSSLRAAAGEAARCFMHRIGRPAEAMVLEVEPPLGDSFYQAEKGIKNNEWAVRDGGLLVLAAPCGAGIGQDHFVNLLRAASTWAAAEARVREWGYRLGDHKAVRLRYLTDPACRGVRVRVVSAGLSEADAAVLGVRKARTVEEALAEAGVDPGGGDVYRVCNAGNVVVQTG